MGVYKNEKNKTWYFKLQYKDANGKYKYVTRRGFKTKGDAKKAEASYRLKLEYLPKNKDITFGRLYDEYVEYKRPLIKESTLLTDDNKVKLHLLPFFEKKKIIDITTQDINKWQQYMLDHEKDYSVRYIRKIQTIMSSILKYGMKKDYIRNNVAQQFGQVPIYSKGAKQEMKFYTYEQWLEFEAVLEDDEYKVLFQTLYFTGLRLGEALALTFEDIESSNGMKNIHVNKTVTNKTKNAGYAITKPKNATANRVVSVPDVLRNSLISYYEECKSFSGFNDRCFVFGIVKPLSTTTIERKKNKACALAGLEQIRIHDFRHSHASFLINNSVPPIYISKRLGHSNMETTLNIYVHMFDQQNQIALDIMNKVLSK